MKAIVQAQKRTASLPPLSLIDAASSVVGSQAELCRVLDVPSSVMSNWKSGHSPCPAEYRAMMYTLCGERFSDAAAMAMYDANAHKPLGAKLLAMAKSAASRARNSWLTRLLGGTFPGRHRTA